MTTFASTREELFEQFATHTENTISVEFVRDEQPGLGFSPEIYEQLNDCFLAFLAARGQQWFDENPGRGMTKLSVSIRVEHE